MIEKLQHLEVYKEAKAQELLTVKVRKGSKLIKLVEFPSRAMSKATKTDQRSLATLSIMGGFVAGASFSNNNEFTLVSSQALALLGGLMAGGFWRPVSSIVKRRTEENILDFIEKSETFAPLDIVPAFTKYDTVSCPSSITNLLRGRSGAENDIRAKAAISIYKKNLEASSLNNPNFNKKERREIEKEQRYKTILTIAEVERLAQIKRRSKDFIMKESVKKVADWAVGVLGLGSIAYSINSLLENHTIAGISGLADDAVYLGSMFLSTKLGKLFRIPSVSKLRQKEVFHFNHLDQEVTKNHQVLNRMASKVLRL